jgi:hypothetical protein
MSRRAFSIQRSAFGQAPVLLDFPSALTGYPLAIADCLPLAGCRVPSVECPVSEDANEFTVTTAVTSVMNRGLADSVLIGVSGFALGEGFHKGVDGGA